MRVILVEFNELSPVLMDKFIAAGKLPSFERLRGESQVYLTDAQEQQSDSSRGSSGPRSTAA